ncbi:MAG: (Fe-S)-binding protein, partial [candidate division KSB1 bacterium]|nr:(Fe-S)-binding protein [candidate division KSB1 bacterium]
KSTKMVHIMEFTADLFRNGKLKVDPSRNDNFICTFHDSCNTARGMGIFEEPRYVIKQVCNHFYEMPENTIREETFCCGSGAGLGNDENIEMRMRGAMPRATALGHVKEKHNVNHMLCICAIDRATLHALTEYWQPEVNVGGVHEMVGNALIMEGEKRRTKNLRGEPLPGMEGEEDDEE